MTTPNPTPTTREREAAGQLIKDYGELSVKKWGDLLESIAAALASERRESLTVESVRDYLASLPHNQDRIDFITGLGVCKYCGGLYLPCYCMRDD